jgi:hypothetical protein
MPTTDADEWFDAAPPDQREVLTTLRRVILKTGPGIMESIKWSRPCYAAAHGLFCYLHRSRNHVTLGFHRGTSLDDPRALLEGTGKDMRHIKFTPGDDLQLAPIRKLLAQAYAL